MIKDEILKALKESSGYLSGQELCEQLSVSRTAVWKAVSRLKEEGYEIDSVPNRGYCLLRSPDAMTEPEIRSFLETKIMGQNLICFADTDSTNIQAKLQAENGAPHGTLVCSDQQTKGRGRRGRAWDSPPGEAIYMSLLLRPRIRPEHASRLTLVMGMAVAEAVNELLAEKQAGIKWPNDLVIEGRKAAGILTEMSAEMDAIHYVVIGIGINVNTRTFPEELKQAISLRQAAGHDFRRAEVIARCMKYFEIYYNRFEQTEDLSLLIEDYNRLLVNRGQQVRVLEPNHEYTGLALGINKEGELLVRCEDGHTEAVYAGEVSVRGIYGYV